MAHAGFGLGIQQRRPHRLAAERLEGQRRHERLGARGHHHSNLAVRFFQQSHQLGALVGGNATGHSQQNSFGAHTGSTIPYIEKGYKIARPVIGNSRAQES